MNRSFRSCALVIVALFAMTMMNAGQEKIHPALHDVMASSPADARIAINILLTNRLSVDYLLNLTRGMGKKERRATVVRALQGHAEATQGRVRAMLATATALGQATEPRIIWMINTIHTTATASVIRSVAMLEEVEGIFYDAEQPGDAVRDGAGIPLGGTSIMTRNAGLNLIRAVQAWGLGYKGEGVIVGNIDSGTDYTHPDLANHFYINPGEDLNHNGRYDASDINGIDDDHNGYVDDIRGWDFGANDNDATYNTESHGVYTSGLVVGDGTNGDSTGVAPGAKMIPLKTYSATGSSTESNNWLAMQYAVMMGADITTSSLSWKWAFSPKPMYHMWRAMSDMEYAAGVLHTNSIGNQGGSSSYPIPYNVSTPGSSPPPWFHKDQVVIGRFSSTLGCGDVNATTDIITSTSGRGPSAWEDIQIAHPEYPYVQPEIYRDYPWETITPRGRALIKPDVSSPGAGTTSTAPGGGYGSFSGTSGATPHVAGTAALVLSANNALLPEHVAQILMTTGVEKGAPGKDTLYGAGRIDAYNAVYAARHSVTGMIHDSATGAPLPYAKVFVPEMSYTFSTDAGGRYIIFSKVDSITMAVSAFAHTPKTTRVFIPDSTTPLMMDFSLAAATTITVSGTVKRSVDSSAVQGQLRVFVDSSSTINPVRTAPLDGNGHYAMNLYPGRYRFEVEPSAPYLPSSIPAVTLAAADSVMNFFVGTADVLLVDDDAGDGQQMFYKLALQTIGKTFSTWDVSLNGVPPLSAFENLKTPKLAIWLTGNEDTLALTNAEFARIASFVAGTGRRGLLLSGQNIAQFADSANLAALAGVRRGGTSTELTVRGAANDSVANGMVMNTTGGNGSGNQTSRDILLLTPGSNAVPFLLYGSSGNDIAGVRRYSGNTRLAFLGFGLEGVPNNQGTTTRAAFLNSVLAWFTAGASTDVRFSPGTPAAFTLEQNYPNPFNPTTRIPFSLPAGQAGVRGLGLVTLKVFDILGREVRTLVNETLQAGSYEVTFDGTGLASGVYFYRLKAGEFVQTKKLLLMR